MPGIPIRLVRRDGETIDLEATDFDGSIKRAIVATPLPILGERLATDLNLVNAVFRMNVILRDDDCKDSDFQLNYASGFIDFSDNGDGRYMDGDVDDGSDLVTRANLDGATFKVIGNNNTTAGWTLTIKLVATGSNSWNASDRTLTVSMDDDTSSNIAAADKGAYLAQKIKEAVAAESDITTFFTPTVATGRRDVSGEQSLLKFTQANKRGPMGDRMDATPSAGDNGDTVMPRIETMSGGKAKGCYSAGDKLQNLIATVINNSILGGFGGIGSDDWEFDEEFFAQEDASGWKSDYIVGLQIPYNSFNNITDVYGPTNETRPHQYSVRNFIYGTGFRNLAKDADANTKDASATPFEIAGKGAFKTGIRGTLVDMDFKYVAGETVYSATLTFMPLDLIVGI